jgi:hypothetical protein
MDYEAWRFWIENFKSVLFVVVGILLWLNTRDRVSSDKLQKLEKEMIGNLATAKKDNDAAEKNLSRRVEDIESRCKAADHPETTKRLNIASARLTKLETIAKSTLSHKDLGEVFERINSVSLQVSEMVGGMKAVKGTVDMIQDYLMNKEGKG